MPHEIHETPSDPIIRRFQPLRKVLRRQPRASSFELPPSDDVSLLPKSFLLIFRKLTHATRDWVDSAKPSVFSRLHIRFPLSNDPQKLFALSRIAVYCQHIDFSFLGMHEVIYTFNTSPSLPSFTALTNLHLDCPAPQTIQPLLSFRQALKSPSVPALICLTISNLTLEGIKALRFGSFTTFGTSDPTSRQMWQRLRLLDITVVPWFGKAAKEINTSLLRVRAPPDDYETWRTGLRILHNWLESFAFTGHLETLNFRWHGQQGPNPFLLDIVGREPTTVQWFSATAIIWRDLKQTQLMGVRITEEDVKKMQERIPQLRSLRGDPELVGQDVLPQAQEKMSGNRESVLVRLGGHPAREAGEKAQASENLDPSVVSELVENRVSIIDFASTDEPRELRVSAAERWYRDLL
ncbi:hypothetical protein N7G274_007632 [Stereocaulon virgatum]|uniref:F-box domain-containing protein n=1 Tax=Stereocaulon virgatum TaxID=373712 RepID=A0ABR4A8V3_9LECA